MRGIRKVFAKRKDAGLVTTEGEQNRHQLDRLDRECQVLRTFNVAFERDRLVTLILIAPQSGNTRAGGVTCRYPRFQLARSFPCQFAGSGEWTAEGNPPRID